MKLLSIEVNLCRVEYIAITASEKYLFVKPLKCFIDDSVQKRILKRDLYPFLSAVWYDILKQI